MTQFPGKDIKTLRNLAVALARDCVFGPQVMQESTRSGRGPAGKKQLDPEKLQYIKNIVAGQACRNSTDPDFELIWDKCLISIGKQCQILRNKEKKKLIPNQ